MRIVLSRKGFDSSAGGCPSPIFPDGRILSLPIPDKSSPIVYREISFEGHDVGELVAQLTREPKRAGHCAHLDPDLRYAALTRLPGWRPLLGQTGSAQGHLRNERVQPGDLFIFFGSFRRIERSATGWCFQKNSSPLHLIWGWLQIAEILNVDGLSQEDYPWARYHPHFHYGKDEANTLYLAADRLTLDGKALGGIPGSGVFPRFEEKLVLTAPDAKKQTQWRLPSCFFPSQGGSRLSYNRDLERWRLDGDFCFLDSAPRGQEFVFDCQREQAPMDWIRSLLVGQTV